MKGLEYQYQERIIVKGSLQASGKDKSKKKRWEQQEKGDWHESELVEIIKFGIRQLNYDILIFFQWLYKHEICCELIIVYSNVLSPRQKVSPDSKSDKKFSKIGSIKKYFGSYSNLIQRLELIWKGKIYFFSVYVTHTHTIMVYNWSWQKRQQIYIIHHPSLPQSFHCN